MDSERVNDLYDFVDLAKSIEDASQSLSDLTANTELDTDEIIEDNNDNINLVTEYPYIIFMRADIIRVMNLCNKIVQTKSDIAAYNSISLVPVPEFKTLNLYVTNELSHFNYQAELIGDSSEMLKDNISIPFIVLQKIVKLMGNKVLIYKKDNTYYIRLVNGDLILDVRPADMKILTFPGEISTKVADISIDTLGQTVNCILPLLSSEIKGEARRINFTGESAYYNSSFYYIESNLKTPVMCLSYRDADFISRLSKYYKGEMIQIFSVKSDLSRLYFKIR